MLFYADDTYTYAPEPSAWPMPWEWNAILRGASQQAGLDPRHTLLCHLACRASAVRRIPIADARALVRSSIAAHLYHVACECGLAPDYATAIAQRAYWWIESLQEGATPYHADTFWPTPEQWLAIDRGAASRIDLDGRFTLTANLASIVAPRRRLTVTAAKRWVHGRLASHAAQLARELGFGMIAGFIVSVRINQWLNSFDA